MPLPLYMVAALRKAFADTPLFTLIVTYSHALLDADIARRSQENGGDQPLRHEERCKRRFVQQESCVAAA
jgi:hypothetical protein